MLRVVLETCFVFIFLSVQLVRKFNILLLHSFRCKFVQSSVNYSKKAIKNHHGEVPVVVQGKKIKHNTNSKKKKTKLNFDPSTMYLCLGACTTVRVRST